MTIRCVKCLADYPDGYDHQCIPWMMELVKIAQKSKEPDRPTFGCFVCAPFEDCPKECINRNHKTWTSHKKPAFNYLYGPGDQSKDSV